jgi:hypothetical protein
VGLPLLVINSPNEFNQNELFKPSLRPQMRCASLPSGSPVRLGTTAFFEGIHFPSDLKKSSTTDETNSSDLANT